MENQLMMKVIAIMVILSVSNLSVRGHKQHAAKIPAARHAGLIPPTMDMNLYCHEFMNCYAVNKYPCMINPMTFTGHVTCLTKDKVCDGLHQCPYGDDESGQCGPLAQMCRSYQIRCANGECATPCDGRAECPNGMDEQSCYRCAKDEIMCSDMKCAKTCNGKRECPGGIDELRCLSECKPGQIICPRTGKCAEVCDNHAECTRQEDELKCESRPEKCDLEYIVKCAFESCAKHPDCDKDDLDADLGDLIICLAVDIDYLKEANAIGDLYSQGCDSREQTARCMCRSKERENVPECIEEMIFELLIECVF